MSDPLLDLIARLPPAEAPADHTRRVTTRCHRVLARRAAALDAATRPPRWRAWPRALVIVSTVYFAEALRQALRVYEAAEKRSLPSTKSEVRSTK